MSNFAFGRLVRQLLVGSLGFWLAWELLNRQPDVTPNTSFGLALLAGVLLAGLAGRHT